MRKLKFRGVLVMIASLALVAAACSSGGDDPSPTDAASPTGGGDATGTVCETNDTTGDLLAQICENGVIRVSTDPAYPPQSSLNPETEEFEGFDIDVATGIADRLGVDIQWETPKWEPIVGGNWQGRWDMSVGSITVTQERAEVLDFTPAYYFTPASIAVAEGSDITSVDDLDGKTVGVCSGCTYDFFLQGSLEIPGFEFPEPPAGIEVRGFDTDTTAFQALSSDQVDAVMSALPTIEAAIDEGLEMQVLGDPLFYEPLSVGFDKASELDNASLVAAVSTIIEEMHADGSLSEMSMTWYDTDLTVESA